MYGLILIFVENSRISKDTIMVTYSLQHIGWFICRNIKAMLLSVIELRATDWGRKEKEVNKHMNGGSHGSVTIPQVRKK